MGKLLLFVLLCVVQEGVSVFWNLCLFYDFYFLQGLTLAITRTLDSLVSLASY